MAHISADTMNIHSWDRGRTAWHSLWASSVWNVPIPCEAEALVLDTVGSCLRNTHLLRTSFISCRLAIYLSFWFAHSDTQYWTHHLDYELRDGWVMCYLPRYKHHPVKWINIWIHHMHSMYLMNKLFSHSSKFLPSGPDYKFGHSQPCLFICASLT